MNKLTKQLMACNHPLPIGTMFIVNLPVGFVTYKILMWDNQNQIFYLRNIKNNECTIQSYLVFKNYMKVIDEPVN